MASTRAARRAITALGPALCRGHSAEHHRLAARHTGRCRRSLGRGPRPAGQTSAARRRTSAGLGQGAGAQPARQGLAHHQLAGRNQRSLTSRFARLRVRPAHRDYQLSEPWPEEWLLIEWPEGEKEPTKYWLSTLPEDIGFARHGRSHQIALAHRARLSGAQTGNWARATSKAAAGAASIITPPSASRLMAS